MSRRRFRPLCASAILGLMLAACSPGTSQDSASSTDTGDTGTPVPAMDDSQMASTSPMEDGPAGSMAMNELTSLSDGDMQITLIESEPVGFQVFEGTEAVDHVPSPEDDMHFMVVLAAPDTGQRIPYASVQASITGPDGTKLYDERLWPMISSMMGAHYGDNVNLGGPGTYQVDLTIGVPQVARHTDGYAAMWKEPFRLQTSFDWQG